MKNIARTARARSSRPVILRLGAYAAAAALLAGTAPPAAVAASPFIDGSFGVQRIADLTYGVGSVGNPASGAIPLTLDLYTPTGIGVPARLPAILVIHGGAFVTGDRRNPPTVAFCEAYTRRGYVTVSIDYRLLGDDPTDEPGVRPGATALQRTINAAAQDAAKAVRWMRANAPLYRIDPARIAVAGSSAGAVTALLLGAGEAATLGPGAEVRAIVDLWGGMYGYESLVDAGDPPVFIVHGTADPTVPFAESLALVARLDAVGVAYLFYPIDGCGHGCWDGFFGPAPDGGTVDRHCAEFLFDHLDLATMPAGRAPRLRVRPGDGS